MKTVAFFNNKGGVGKTTLVYHLAWMFHELGARVVALDLDPQANLTSAFFDDDTIQEIWSHGDGAATILGALRPLLDRLGDVQEPVVEEITSNLGLLPGHLGFGLFEDRFAEAWSRCLDDRPEEAGDAFRVTSAFYRLAKRAAQIRSADLVLIDLGPSLGSLNRAALVACDFVVMPLGADFYSLHGLRNLGLVLQAWRKGWKTRLEQENYPARVSRPSGDMQPLGYIVVQQVVQADRPALAYHRWADRIPGSYYREILQDTSRPLSPDPHELASLKHSRSLMPLAQVARKPMFLLTPADGAIGGHAEAVRDCWRDFRKLARRIAKACGVATL